jgi:hypothetical protein
LDTEGLTGFSDFKFPIGAVLVSLCRISPARRRRPGRRLLDECASALRFNP